MGSEAIVHAIPMANAGSMLVAFFAIALGLVMGYAGIDIMLEAGSFAEGESRSDSGFLGLGRESSSSAEVPTAPWVGLLLVAIGGSALLFGLRGLYVTFEGRGEA